MSSDSGEQEPIAKRQKTYDADGPVEDDKTAREKLREAGFDPDDVQTVQTFPNANAFWGLMAGDVTPMTHFAFHGDLPMCRYLYHVREATTEAKRNASYASTPWFPLLAAVRQKHYKLAKWLFLNGADKDIRLKSRKTLRSAFGHLVHMQYARKNAEIMEQVIWYISHGALQDDNSTVDEQTILLLRDSLDCEERSNTICCSNWGFWKGVIATFLDAANCYLGPKFSFDAFLLGTLSRRITSNGDVVASSSTCAQLGPHRGVLEKISDYVGYVKSKSEVGRVRDFRDALHSIDINDLDELNRELSAETEIM